MVDYDVIVGIPSYNSAATIGFVIRQAALGLDKYFSHLKGLILVSDGGSTDGTVEVANVIRLKENVGRVVENYSGLSGKGNAVKHIFNRALEFGASTVILVDSDLRSITPEWIRLLGAVHDGFDLITPMYLRSRYDGMLTKHIAYPLTRALYGVRIRQPIGGDFGLSIKLVESLLKDSLWNSKEVQKFGVDIFITNSALARGFRVAQAYLGSKVHEMKDPTRHLKAMFYEVSKSLFNLALKHRRVWWEISGSKDAEILRGDEKPFECIQPISVNFEAGVKRFLEKFEENRSIIRDILDELFDDFLKVVEGIREKGGNAFPASLWARIVYRHLSAYAGNKSERVFESLYACWLGRVLSYIHDVSSLSDNEVENKVNSDAEKFEAEKNYLRKIYPK